MYELRLRTTTVPIHSLIDLIDRNQLRLPEIQRDYVWKPAQVAGLLDSLYRRYPSGSVLLWETDDPITERDAKIENSGALPVVGRPQYLLDGQQRITSLHRVFHDHERAQVVFNVETEKFQIQSAATARDPRWVHVYGILAEKNLFGLVETLSATIPQIDRNELARRLQKVQQIGEYTYHVEIVENLPYPEVTEIFVRVNSRGRALKSTDLALATLSARWPGVISELEHERDKWLDAYPALDLAFLARALAAVATESRSLSGFSSADTEVLKDGWQSVRSGLSHLVSLLRKNAGIETSTLLPSTNALIPIVAYLGTRPDRALSLHDANALLYWLFGVFMTARYSTSADTVIAQDAQAVRGPEPIQGLYRNLSLLGGRLEVSEQSLAGKGAGSAYFLLSYLAAKRAGASDWFTGTRIGLDAEGKGRIEYHHIHPQATLRSKFGKSEINDLANLAFISERANKRISNRSPAKYFPEVGDDELRRHFVPVDEHLRTVDAYPEFIRARRSLLAAAMTDFLDSLRPSGMAHDRPIEPATEQLAVSIYDPGADDPKIIEFTAEVDSGSWTGRVPLHEFQRFLSDVDDGLTGGLELGEEVVLVEGVNDRIDIPVGPFLVSGTISEWRFMVERELDQIIHAHPTSDPSPRWQGERIPIAVLDSE